MGLEITDLIVHNSAAFSVSPTAPTPLSGDNTTKLATTEYITLNTVPLKNYSIIIDKNPDSLNVINGSNNYINGENNIGHSMDGSFVIGANNLLFNTDNCWVSGTGNRVSHNQNIIKGTNNIMGGIDPNITDPSTPISNVSDGSILIGHRNKNNGNASYSLGIGSDNVNDLGHEHSFLFGKNLISTMQNSHWTGWYNLPDANVIFGIGNGIDDTTRSNLLEIRTDGQIISPNLNYPNILNDKSFITKEYADYKLQDKLISGTNIKTVNGGSVLGTGDITIEAGGISKFRFTAMEGQTAFVCTGATLNDPLVYLNGILQDQGDVYTYSGNTVTFVNARYLNEKIVVIQ